MRPNSPRAIPSRMRPSCGPTWCIEGARAMPIDILMPALSPTMEEGNLAKWLKNEGDKVASGDVIAEIETDKATMEVEAVDEGTIGKILVPAGTEGVKVNTPIAVLLQEGESAGDIGKGNGAAAAKAQTPVEAKPGEPAQAAGDAGGKAREPQQEAAARTETAKLPAEPKAETTADPAIPAGTEMVSMTVREALRDAMAE